jgi:hypothetical protein
MWEPFLWIALLVTAWRWLTHRRSRPTLGPMPNVGDAPPGAEPMIRPRLDDNGLATYSFAFPDRPAPGASEPGNSTRPRRSSGHD